jgi:hypothetical protein
MKCKEIKYFLLGSENPDQPPADVQAHLAVCTACQEWQNRLVQIEMNLPFLPVPQSAARSILLKRIFAQPRDSGQWAVAREQPAVISEQAAEVPPALSGLTKLDQPPDKPIAVKEWPGTMPIPVDRSRPGRIRTAFRAFRSMEPGLRRFAGGGVAAAILLGVLGWLVLLGPHQPPPVAQRSRPDPEPLLASILQRDLRLAEAENAKERVLALADLAEDLSQEIKALAPKPQAKDFLEALVKNYRKVVVKGLVEVANDLTDADRNPILSTVANRLHQAGREADELAKTKAIADSSKKPLQELSQIAYDADEKLRSFRTEAAAGTGGNASATAVAVRKERP